jgi:multiple sugar transport system ATP-binding protein
MASVIFDGVNKVYPDGTLAVHDLDLQIADGELVVFVGPSGCGKTTALRMVSGKTVYENLAFPLKLRHMSKQEIDRRVNQIARLLELEEQLKRRPRQLSGGQRQRVAKGRAIVREPQVFLMDEPLSNLDAKLRTQMRAEVGLLHKELGVTTIYVTHDQVEAMTLGERVAVMRKGELQQIGPPQEVYDRPANLFVAGFIGSPSMNFVEATLGR